MKKWMLFVSICMFALVGCTSSDYSQNMRVATARATAGVATKAVLDEIDLDKYDKTKQTVITVAQEVKLFCDNGKIADLPVDKAEQKVINYMIEKGWSQYVSIVAGIFSVVEAQTVPVEKLGSDNLFLIKTGLDEVIESAMSSKQEWRRPTKRGLFGREDLPPNKVQLYRE